MVLEVAFHVVVLKIEEVENGGISKDERWADLPFAMKTGQILLLPVRPVSWEGRAHGVDTAATARTLKSSALDVSVLELSLSGCSNGSSSHNETSSIFCDKVATIPLSGRHWQTLPCAT